MADGDVAEVADLIRQAHEGEVLGEALFTRLSEVETDPARRTRMRAAQLLEGQTRAAVEQLAADLGVSLDAAPAQKVAGEQAAGALAGLAWGDRMAAIAQATGTYRSLYEQLGRAVPDPGHPSMVALLAHERALNTFAAAEAETELSDEALHVLVGALDADRRHQLADAGA